MNNGTTYYLIDGSGEILDVYGDWDHFAEENKGGSIKRDEIVGKNLFDFINGQNVKEIYREMHNLLNSNPARNISFHYRCDSPTSKRHMVMTLRCLRNAITMQNAIEYESKIVEEKPFEKTIAVGKTGNDFMHMCSWCKQYKYPPDAIDWKPIETIFELPVNDFKISHGICEPCNERMRETMKDILNVME